MEAIIQRKSWKWVAAALAVVALLAFLATRFTAPVFDWKLALASVEHLNWGWLALSLVPIFGTYYGRALRWAVFLRPLKERPSMRNLLVATIIGFTAITLFGRPGEFVRPYLIAVKERVSVPSQLAAWLLERLFDLLMALLFFGFALIRLSSTGVHVGPRLAWVLSTGGYVVAGCCALILVLLLSMRHFAEPMRDWLLRAIRFLPESKFKKIEHLINACVQGVEATRSDAALLLVFAYSVLEWWLIALCYWCLAQSFAGTLHFSFSDVIIFLGFVSFGAIVQIPGIGGGMQVVTVVVLTELFGIKLEPATSFAVLIWVLTFVAITPLGLILALKEGLNWRSLRALGREVV